MIEDLTHLDILDSEYTLTENDPDEDCSCCMFEWIRYLFRRKKLLIRIPDNMTIDELNELNSM